MKGVERWKHGHQGSPRLQRVCHLAERSSRVRCTCWADAVDGEHEIGRAAKARKVSDVRYRDGRYGASMGTCGDASQITRHSRETVASRIGRRRDVARLEEPLGEGEHPRREVEGGREPDVPRNEG